MCNLMIVRYSRRIACITRDLTLLKTRRPTYTIAVAEIKPSTTLSTTVALSTLGEMSLLTVEDASVRSGADSNHLTLC